MKSWQIFMLVSSGLFAGGTLIAATRIPAWRRMSVADFIPDFARTIVVADKVQPALLLIALVSTVGFALHVEATARSSAMASSLGLIAILVASGAVLVPLQRRIIGSQALPDGTEAMRDRWLRGHVGRCVFAIVSFVLAVVAAAV
jgi:Domain of unknown function (DUF1772)